MKLRLLRGPADSDHFSRSTNVERSAVLPFVALAAYSHRNFGCQEQSWELNGVSILPAGKSCCSFQTEFLYNPRAESSEAKQWPSSPSLPWWAAPMWISPRSMTCFRGLARRSSARNLTLGSAAKEPIRRWPRVCVARTWEWLRKWEATCSAPPPSRISNRKELTRSTSQSPKAHPAVWLPSSWNPAARIASLS